MNSSATKNIDGVGPVTALDLVNIAGVLIDGVDIDDNPNDSTRNFRTGVKAGIVSMCKASTSAINAFGALSLEQLAGSAPADQHGDAKSNQGVTSNSGGTDQHSTTTQLAGLIFSNRPHSSQILGEHCAGRIVDITTGVVYEVMVMPGELTCVTWGEAKRTIQALGGDLPTPTEMLMLNGLLGRLAFQDSYWVDEKVKFDGDAEDSISYFSDGVFDFSDAKDRMSARGVRRVCIGDAADENLDEVDDHTVIVPGHAVPAKPGASAIETWGLAAARAIPAAPGVDAPDSGVTLDKMTKLVAMQRRACDLLEASGVPSQCEAAGDLRSSTCDVWDAVHEQVSIDAPPLELDKWMATPAGLARVLVSALRGERIEEPGEYNDAVEDCIMAVVGTLSAGAAADKSFEMIKDHLTEVGKMVVHTDDAIPASGPDLSDRPDLQQLRDSMRADLAEPAPKVRIEDVVETLAQLRITADEAIDGDATAVCRRASRIIEGLLPHAGAGVSA